MNDVSLNDSQHFRIDLFDQCIGDRDLNSWIVSVVSVSRLAVLKCSFPV